MTRIGIVGAGVSGLHLGLWLRHYGIDATIYSEKTPAQFLSAQLRNIVIRNSCTREREARLASITGMGQLQIWARCRSA